MENRYSPTIGFGEVIHKRTRPKLNTFRYKVFYLRIPMRSRKLNPKLLSKFGVGDNQFSWISFFDKDHGLGGDSAIAWVESELEKNKIFGADGEIWLQTFPRVLGYLFNPVSFWFCENSLGQTIAIFAEVNNTFGGRHTYLLRNENADFIQNGQSLTTVKQFHVSPFFKIEGHYLFRFMRRRTDGDIIQNISRIEYWANKELQLSTSISGAEVSLSSKSIMRAKMMFPFLTLGIISRIHWQAMKLWIKRVHFYGKSVG
jgi:DUF1365 family protein